MALVKYNNNSISAITAASGLTAGAMTLIKEQTASSSSTISFVNGTSDVVISSTYPIYLFKFINAHPATNSVDLQFNGSSDTGSNYNVTKTTTAFQAYQTESGSATSLMYEPSQDIAQGTGVQKLAIGVGNDNDQSCSGVLHLYNPSSTTFVKHFISTFSNNNASDYFNNTYIAGYCNVTAAIDGVQFSFSSGNIDAGVIKLYGIS